MPYSYKTRRLEILALVITGALKFIVMDWLDFRTLYIVTACLFWFGFIYKRYKEDPRVLQRWGFRKRNLKKSFLIILPFALVAIAGIVLYGFETEAAMMNWHILPILVFYPVWGLFQQFMIAGLLAGNLVQLPEIKLTDRQVILLTALLFALVHFPSIFLMGYVFVMEAVFLSIYFQWGNIWPLGLYHGWVSSFFLFIVLGRDLLIELSTIF
ncbi:MAG: hypothetical protein K9J27_05600 [Bacteroidales bacterium]|nr:hypothetical protein [Bacteroidales bacterium]MCF8333394.1 hypothetical protein [Bacteroidales bacterium]